MVSGSVLAMKHETETVTATTAERVAGGELPTGHVTSWRGSARFLELILQFAIYSMPRFLLEIQTWCFHATYFHP